MALPEFKTKLQYVWQYLNTSITNFKVKLQGYRIYKATITQSGADAPEVNVIENSLGLKISFFYANPGIYIGIFDNNALTLVNPTTSTNGEIVEFLITPNSIIDIGNFIQFNIIPVWINVIEISSNDLLAGPVDDTLGFSTTNVIEIKVYNKK